MADNSVDSIILEIESSTKETDAGLDELASALTRIKNAVKNIQTSKLTDLKTALNGLTVSEKVVQPLESVSNSLSKLASSVREVSLDKTVSELRQIESLTGAGENIESLSTDIKQLNDATKKQQNVNSGALKNIVESINGINVDPSTSEAVKAVGAGFKSVASSVNSMKDIEPEKLNQIADTVSKVGSALGNLGSNNKINIKISAEGVKAVKQPIEEIKQQLGDIANANLNLGEGAEELSTPFEGAKEILDGIEKTTEQIVSETKTFAESIADVGKNFKTLNWGKDLKKEIEQTEKRFDTLLQKEQKMLAMGNVDENSNTWKSLQYDLTECANKLDILYEKQDREWAMTEGFDEARKKAERLKQEILEIMKAQEEAKGKKLNLGELFSEDNVLSTLNMIQNGLRMIGSGFNSVSQSAREVSVTFKNVQAYLIGFMKILTTPVRLFGNSLSKQIKTLTAQFANMSKKVQAHLKKMSDFWKRTMRTFTFMVVRKAITAILGDMKEAVDSLALWSKNFGTPFNDSISSIVADFKYMGKAILAAVEPLINAVAPIIAKLAEWFGILAGKVAEFMAAITGQSYWMKAKKNVTDYSDSVNKANKATKGALQGFDELNNITTQNNSDTGLNLDKVKNDWEKMPVSEKAKEWADKIKQIFADLWEPIGKAWDRMKDYVLGGWKYMTGEIKSLAKDMWDDFIEVWKQEATVKIFENIFGMIGDIEYGIGNLVKNFHEVWNEGETGKHILENIRDIVGILVEHARNVTLYFKEWSKGVTFDNLLKSVERLTASLKKVADFIGGEFEDVMILGVMTFIEWFIEEGLPKINNAIAHVIDEFDFDKIREDLKPVISGAEKLLEHLFGGATDGAESLGLKIANWFNSDKFTKFTTALSRIMAVFTEDRIATVIDGIGTGLLRIADAIVDIASSDTVIGIFEAIGKAIDKLGASGIANIVDGLVVAIAGFGALAGVAGVISLITAKLGKLFFTLAGAVGAIATGVKLYKWIKGFGNIGGSVKNITTITDVLSKLSKIKLPDLSKFTGQLSKIGELQMVEGGVSIAEFFTADMGALVSSGAVSLGGMIAAGIVSGIVAFFVGADIGKTIGKYIFPDDKELYEQYSGITGTLRMIKDSADAIFKKDATGETGVQTLFKANSAKATLGRELGFTKDNAYEKALEKIREGVVLTKEQMSSLRKDFDLSGEQMSNLTKVNEELKYIKNGIHDSFSDESDYILNGTNALKEQRKQIELMGTTTDSYQAKLRSQIGKKIDFKKFDASDYAKKAFKGNENAGTQTNKWRSQGGLDDLKKQRDEVQKEYDELQKHINDTPLDMVSQDEFNKLNELDAKIMELNAEMQNYQIPEMENTSFIDKFKSGLEDTSGAFKLWGQDIEDGFLAVASAQDEKINPMVDKVKTKFTEMKDNAISLKDDLKGAWDLMAADISTWYTEQVAPWFTVEKWTELGENIKTAIKTKWDETVGQWVTDITTWWDTNVAPWFTQEKWTEVLGGIEPAFKEAFKGAVNVAIEALNKLLEGIEKMINEALGADGLGKIGEYASKVGIELDLNFSSVKIPRIPKFEKGGFPEDGLFYANHNELIGNFNNGRTAVANNGQIIDGISSGVEMANAQQNSLLSEMISLLGVIADKDLTIGDDAIFSSYQRGSARYAKRYGI